MVGHPAAKRVVTRLVPALAVAMVAAALGFLAMQISKVPMIRQFGAMLVLGVAVIFAVVVFVPLAFLVWRERRRPSPRAEPAQGGALLERGVRGLARAGRARVIPIILVGAVVVAAGFAVEGANEAALKAGRIANISIRPIVSVECAVP